jgi:hypothetical protein
VQSEVVEPWSWRNPPRSVSLEDIANAPDEKVWQLIFLCQVARVGGSALQQYEIVKAWSPGLRMLYATQVVDDEVSNGGFNQFFFNSSGQFAEEAVEGFQLIGASARADIVARAIQQFFKDAPALRPYHQQRTMEAFMESYSHTDLGTFDQAWYEAPEFFSARTAYIRAHPLEFVLPPAE